MLLGDHYLRSLALNDTVQLNAPVSFLTSEKTVKYVRGQGQVRAIPLANTDTQRFHCGLVGLKGEIAKRLLSRLVQEGKPLLAQLYDPTVDVLALLDDTPVAKAVPSRAAAKANPNVDHVIHIPESWWQKPHREKLRYFIPEWDDLGAPCQLYSELENPVIM